LPELSFQQLLIRALAALIVSLVHGLSVVLLSRAAGDRGPEYDGRLTANAFFHLDLIGGVALVMFACGWARPSNVDGGLSGARRAAIVAGSLLVSLAFAFLLYRVVTAIPATALPGTATATVRVLGRYVAAATAGLVILNVIPIWPLTGSHLVPGPRDGWQEGRRAWSSLALFAAVALLAVAGILGPATAWLTGVLIGS